LREPAKRTKYGTDERLKKRRPRRWSKKD